MGCFPVGNPVGKKAEGIKCCIVQRQTPGDQTWDDGKCRYDSAPELRPKVEAVNGTD